MFKRLSIALLSLFLCTYGIVSISFSEQNGIDKEFQLTKNESLFLQEDVKENIYRFEDLPLTAQDLFGCTDPAKWPPPCPENTFCRPAPACEVIFAGNSEKFIFVYYNYSSLAIFMTNNDHKVIAKAFYKFDEFQPKFKDINELKESLKNGGVERVACINWNGVTCRIPLVSI